VLNPDVEKELENPDKQTPQKPKFSRHWVLWTLLSLFIVGSITAMMLADYYYAPGESGATAAPKDAADK
jgi:quinol-cytochrome oxidoreductase complex cytochrome b subunit